MLTSGTLRWAETKEEVELLGENVTWFGTTTNHYWLHGDVERRLLVDHTLGIHNDSGVWQRNIKCRVIG